MLDQEPAEASVSDNNELSIEFEDKTVANLSFEEVNAGMTVAPVLTVSADWDFAVPSEETQLLIQEALFERGFYNGKRNGNWGPLTVFAIRQAVSVLVQSGSAKPLDPRVADRDLCELVHEYATLFGNYSLAITSSTTQLNEDIWLAFLKGLESEDK
jgi:hypothetical protein